MLSESSTKPWSQEQYSCPPEPTAQCCVQFSTEQVVLAENIKNVHVYGLEMRKI